MLPKTLKPSFSKAVLEKKDYVCERSFIHLNHQGKYEHIVLFNLLILAVDALGPLQECGSAGYLPGVNVFTL